MLTRCTLLAILSAGWWCRNLPAIIRAGLASMVLAQTSPAFGNPSGDFQKKFVADRLKPLQEGKTMADIAEDVIPELIAGGASR